MDDKIQELLENNQELMDKIWEEEIEEKEEINYVSIEYGPLADGNIF